MAYISASDLDTLIPAEISAEIIQEAAEGSVVTLAQKMYNEPIDNILKYKKDVFELFTESKLKRMLTEFEFYNMKIEPETKCLDDVIKKCENILNRYTYCLWCV
jgi:hypothetical protein